MTSPPRASNVIALLIIAIAFCSGSARAGEFHNALSLQGYTGIINTPNAAVTDEGEIYLLFSNQIDEKFRAKSSRQENYLFNVGLFSFAELGGRLTEAPGSCRDLSANFKVRIPFIPQGYHLPDIAVGVQDVGGGLRFLQTKYIVASEELWRLRLSIGYGFGPDRMDGVFGGAELKALDWLYLLGDYDTKETSVGVRVITPRLFDIPVNLHATAKTTLNGDGDIDLGVGLTFPLGLPHESARPLPPPAVATPLPAQAAAATEPLPLSPAHGDGGDAAGWDRALGAIRALLVADGFQNVRVGEKEGKLLVVEYENSRYSQNELDAMGLVLGTAVSRAPAGGEAVRLVMKKKGIRIMSLTVPISLAREFLGDAGALARFREGLDISNDPGDDDGVRFAAGDGNPSWLRASLVLQPELKTFVGTEVGVFDYLLSLKPELHLNTWKGGEINLRGEIPLTWSENYDNGKTYRNYREGSRFERAMLFQAIKPAPSLMASIGGGMILKDIYGTLNEIVWTPGDGRHRFRLKQAYAEEPDRYDRRDVFLASYRYFFPTIESWIEGTGGKFWGQDRGVTLELKRFFGDTAFSVYYKNSRTDEGERLQVGGVQFSLPLTLRRDMKPYPVQLRGSDEWSYAQETVIVSPGEHNYVGRSIGINPQPSFGIDRMFQNRDRLSTPYLKEHLLRMRDAWERWGNAPKP